MQFPLFSIAGIPINVSIWALLLIAWLSFNTGNIALGVLMGLAVLLSVLIHELGHAFVARHYRLQPQVVLHALGGTTFHQPADTDGKDALIIAAGPGVQLLASGVGVVGWVLLALVSPELAGHPYVTAFMSAFLFVGVFWAGINILPMWPMDGGKLFRLGLLHLFKVKPALADRITHITGIVFAVGMVLISLFVLRFLGWIGMFIFGMIVVQNFIAMRQGASAGPVRRQNTHAKSLLSDARQAFEDRNWSEAARLGHQIRAEPDVPDKTLAEVFEIIALAHIFDGRLEEGVRFARRAPASPQLVQAQVRALAELRRVPEAREVLESRGGVLPAQIREELARTLG